MRLLFLQQRKILHTFTSSSRYFSSSHLVLLILLISPPVSHAPASAICIRFSLRFMLDVNKLALHFLLAHAMIGRAWTRGMSLPPTGSPRPIMLPTTRDLSQAQYVSDSQEPLDQKITRSKETNPLQWLLPPISNRGGCTQTWVT